MKNSISIPSIGRQCDISIGTDVVGMLEKWIPGTHPTIALISDANVLKLHGATIRDALRRFGTVHAYSFEPGEKSKNREVKAAIEDEMLEEGLNRDSVVIGLGGGVTTDLAGYVAGTYLRGVPWIAVPTSLLAAVDASVGGKVGVNTPVGKNLIGLFYQPEFVGIDLDLLATLPAEEVDNGLAEMVKHGLIADREYFERLVSHGAAIRGLTPDVLLDPITRSVEIKAEVVSVDPKESDYRQILNAGHTIAHAVEKVSRYQVSHGRAVAIGLSVEVGIAEILGLLGDGETQLVRQGLRTLDLPFRPAADMEPARILEATYSDKKGREGRPRYALPARVGKMSVSETGYSQPVRDGIVLEAIEEASGCSV